MSSNRRQAPQERQMGACLVCGSPVYQGGLTFVGQEERIFLHAPGCAQTLIAEIGRDVERCQVVTTGL